MPAEMARAGYIALGWFCVALGLIGAVLPIMPTTVFMILAAFFFGRGSPRARAWLLDNPLFGPAIRKWEATGAIAPKAKLWSCLAMAGSLLLALLLGVPYWLLLVQAVALFSAAGFILSRPD